MPLGIRRCTRVSGVALVTSVILGALPHAGVQGADVRTAPVTKDARGVKSAVSEKLARAAAEREGKPVEIASLRVRAARCSPLLTGSWRPESICAPFERAWMVNGRPSTPRW